MGLSVRSSDAVQSPRETNDAITSNDKAQSGVNIKSPSESKYDYTALRSDYHSLCMRRFYRGFAGAARIFRLSRIEPNQTFVSPFNCRTFCVTPRRYLEHAQMGKEKVQFQLKTPKGTKDCKQGVMKSSRHHQLTTIQGMAGTWSFATRSSPP